jgi:phage shock protein PspC (stress-responsive transcriptional regulator)
MHKVITIDLGGQLYQLEERGFELLRAYLEKADAQLAANPDKTEIVRDLEQSISEKFSRNAGTVRTVIATSEVDQILREIGPVEGGTPYANPASTGTESTTPKRLYQIREGAMLSGLCNGIAAYFDVDPTFVRIAFVIAAISEIVYLDQPPIVTVLLYVVLMFVVPYTKTSTKRPSTYGVREPIPHKVQRSVERVKAMFGELHNAR